MSYAIPSKLANIHKNFLVHIFILPILICKLLAKYYFLWYYHITLIIYRELAEWSKAHDWKSCERETVPRVQIPHSLPWQKHIWKDMLLVLKRVLDTELVTLAQDAIRLLAMPSLRSLQIPHSLPQLRGRFLAWNRKWDAKHLTSSIPLFLLRLHFVPFGSALLARLIHF